MKKALDQTVRDLKREVNKKVLKVPSIEQKTLDATNNESRGPHGSLLAEIAQATCNYHDYQLIMAVLWKRIQDTGKNWRHVYKALNVLEYLVIHGSERVIDDTREHAYQISTLSDFLYADSNGRDQGSNVRKKSQSLVALVNNNERLQEIRHKALSNKDNARYNDEHFEGHDGNREDGHVQERELTFRDKYRYHSGDKYSRGRDQNGKDNDEFYGRDDNYRVRANGDYQYRPRTHRIDGYTNNSFDDYDRQSTRSDGGRDDEIMHDERIDVPPSYEEATNDSWSDVQNDKGTATTSLQKSSSPSGPESSRGTNQAPGQSVSGESAQAHEKVVASFDEFDPRWSVSAAPTVASSGLELDIFGLSAVDHTKSSASMLVTSTTTSDDDMLANSAHTVQCETDENPFGDAPFKAIPREYFPSETQTSASATSQASSGFDFVSIAEINMPIEKKMEAAQSYDFENTLGRPIYASDVVDGQHSLANPDFCVSEFSAANSSKDILDGILPWTGHVASVSYQETRPAAQSHFLPQQGFSAYAASNAHNSSMTGSAELQIGQINPFEQPGLLNHLAGQANPFACQAFPPAPPSEMDANKINSTEKPVLSDPQTSQGAVSSHTFQPASLNGMQATQTISMDKQGLSYLQTYQASSVALYAGQSTAPANYQGFQINHFQQQSLSTPLPSQTAPDSSQALPIASRIDPHVAQINTLNQPGLLAPQTSQLASGPFKAVHSSVPVNGHGAQTNPLQQARLSAVRAQAVPVSSQAFFLEASPNPQSAQLNPLQQSSMSDPQSSLGVPLSSHPFQSSAPANIQAPQINPSLQRGLSDPLTSEATVALYQPFRPVAPTSVHEAQIHPLLQGLSAPIASQNIPLSSQATPSNIQTGQSSFTPQSALPNLMVSSQGSAKPQPSKKNFELKSAVWADTISRGLVNLNISGPKTNPLADIGIDFDDINRKEKRNEVKSSQTPLTSTFAMGKAMGAGSGLGRAGAFVQPLNPTVGSNMGMGMSMGGLGMGAPGMGAPGMGAPGSSMGMVMGIGGSVGNMNQPYVGTRMGVNMGMNIGMGINLGQMHPPSEMSQQGPGFPGAYNPMNAGGGYGQQQPYGGGGYR